MTDRSPDNIAAEALAASLGRSVANNDPARVAFTSFLQANFAQLATQALVDLLRHKNVFSEAEIQNALKTAYDRRTNELRQQGMIVPAAPAVRPTGGH